MNYKRLLGRSMLYQLLSSGRINLASIVKWLVIDMIVSRVFSRTPRHSVNKCSGKLNNINYTRRNSDVKHDWR